MKKICEGADYIFHFAALSDQDCIDHPIEAEDINVGGTVKILEIARTEKIHKLIFASSAMVYGNQDVFPFKEETPVVPAEPYGLYKYFGEQLVRFWATHYGVPSVSLRFFNAYGPQDKIGPHAFVIGRFLDLRIKGQPLTIDGDGTDTRDYIHTKDIARACIVAAEHPEIKKGETFNIGSGIESSLNDLAACIGGPVVHLESRLGARRGPRRRVADISYAKSSLGWSPEITLREGIESIKQNLGIQ